MRGKIWTLAFILFLKCYSVEGGKMLTALNQWFKVACIAENIKSSDHYICDKNGNIVCMPGWSNEALFCTVPICDPGCNGNGNCTAPNTCECWIGWAGPECNQCICLPGCVNGGCQHPFECTCDDGYEGMFCDKPTCSETCAHGDCNIPGECNCHPGWTGPNCDQCLTLPGCSENGYCTKPMECHCHEGWSGPFCNNPICSQGCNTTTGWCVNPNECWCHVGYTGPVCQTPVCYPGCQNGVCNYPWECICTGGYTGMLCDICTDPSAAGCSTQPANQNPAPAGGPFYHPDPNYPADKYIQNTEEKIQGGNGNHENEWKGTTLRGPANFVKGSALVEEIKQTPPPRPEKFDDHPGIFIRSKDLNDDNTVAGRSVTEDPIEEEERDFIEVDNGNVAIVDKAAIKKEMIENKSFNDEVVYHDETATQQITSI